MICFDRLTYISPTRRHSYFLFVYLHFQHSKGLPTPLPSFPLQLITSHKPWDVVENYSLFSDWFVSVVVGFPSWLFPSGFITAICMHFSTTSCMLYAHFHINPLHLILLIIFREKSNYKSIMYFPLVPVTCLFFDPEILNHS